MAIENNTSFKTTEKRRSFVYNVSAAIYQAQYPYEKSKSCANCEHYMLVAAMNPCPCGYYGDPLKPCTCSPGMVTKYQKRISGPLLDRIDIHIEVPRVEFEKLSDQRLGEPSAVIQARVEAARQIQRDRFAVGAKKQTSSDTSAPACNADMRPAEVRQFCPLDDTGRALMKTAMNLRRSVVYNDPGFAGQIGNLSTLYRSRRKPMAVLHLTLKNKFFQQIAGGEKPYEYRVVKPYWTRRLEGKTFAEVHFKNGYAADAPFMRVEIKGISQTIFKGEPHYRIRLGRILEVRNYTGKVVAGYPG
jgi:hypothetical protein